MTNKPPISCYIRTLNEERKIEQTIIAAQKVAQEVVLIDCGSSDKTRQIAESLGAKVYHQDWLGNGFQKRVGEEKAINDWLLDLDADEIVTDELAVEICALFANGLPPENIYRVKMAVITPFGERWSDNSESPRQKLYNKKFYRIPEHKRWDQIELPKGFKPPLLKNAIKHYAFANVDHLVSKLNKVTTRGATDVKLKSRNYLVLRIIFGFPIYFLKHFIKRDFWKAGVYGFAYACIIAFARWMRDVKMYEIYLARDAQNNPNKDLL